MKRGGFLLLVTLGGLLAVGCGQDHLETGYVYTPLGDSSAKRRGYYADPFSPEARKAQSEQTQTDTGANRRMVPGQ